MLRFGKGKSARRRAARAGLLVAALAVALGVGGVSAGTAAAYNCSGATSLIGEGASLQGVAQREVWTVNFNKSPGGICPGFNVEYKAEGSGKGLGAWNFNGEDGTPFDHTRGYTASDDGPRLDQVENAEAAIGNASNVLVIPVVQTAIAAFVNPPKECAVTEITNKQLDEIFRGTLKRWGQLGTKYAKGAGCSGANITRVVRFDGSGTTYQFKNYLSQINTGPLACTEGNKTWQELEPIGNDGKTPNTLWPENNKGGCSASAVSPVITAGANGNGPLVKKVNTTNGSIGYSALPDIEANRNAGGENENPEHDTHWVKLQNNGNVQGSASFASPAEGTLANCQEAQYVVPTNAQVGQSSLHTDWSHVFGANTNIGGTAYPLCTITYDMSLTNFVAAGFSSAVEETVKTYLDEYVVGEQGQEDIEAAPKFYAPLPGGEGSGLKPKRDVLGAARQAAALIG